MMSRVFSLLSLALALRVGAQQPDSAVKRSADTTAIDTIFARARQLVLEGNGAAGRGIIDSAIARTPQGTPAFAEALYWRAALASSAAGAERDYRRIIVEYPVSMRAGDALFSLAQLEMARGDRENATAHLERFVLEHSESPDHGRAGLSLSRLLIEQGRLARGCATLERTRSALPADAVELKNQFDYYAQRCSGVDTVEVAVATKPSPRAPAPTSVPSPRSAAPASATSSRATNPSTAPAARTSAPSTAPSAPASVSSVPSGRPPAPVSARPESANAAARRAAPPRADSARATPKPPERPKAYTPASTPSSSAQTYTLQVAAFGTRAEAEQLADRLTKRGLTARVYGTTRPFRVRIGRFRTEEAATDLLKRLRAQGVTGFVTVAEQEGR